MYFGVDVILPADTIWDDTVWYREYDRQEFQFIQLELGSSITLADWLSGLCLVRDNENDIAGDVTTLDNRWSMGLL